MRTFFASHRAGSVVVRGLVLVALAGCTSASVSATTTTSARVSTSTSSAPPPTAEPTRIVVAESPPSASAPLPFALDSRDTLPEAEPDTRAGARAALVPQAPFSTEIAAVAVSRDGRSVLAADRRGALALIDVATGEVRASRSVARRDTQSILLAFDARGTRALVALVATDPGVTTELYAWDLVMDALDRRLSSTIPVASERRFAIAPLGDALIAIEASESGEPRAVRIDARSGERSAIGGANGRAAGVGFTQGLGRAFVVDEAEVRTIRFVGENETRADVRLAAGVPAERLVALRPGGAQIAAIDDTHRLALCNPVDSSCPSRIAWPDHRAVAVSYGLGGDCIRLTDEHGAQAFVDARTGRFVATFAYAEPMPFVRGACEVAFVPRAGGAIERIPLGDPNARALVPAPASLHVPGDQAPGVAAASDDGRTLAIAYGGTLVLHDLAAASSRAAVLRGVPGIVTDVAWSPSGDELFVRREGEVVRASASRLLATDCPGDSSGTPLADGSMNFERDGCSLYASTIDFAVEGRLLAATRGESPVYVARDPDGNVRRIGAGADAAMYWPASQIPCRAGPGCTPIAFLSRDGALVVVRIGRAVRVFESESGTILAALETDPADEVVLASDGRSLLVARHATGGLDAIDLRTGQRRTVRASGEVELGPGPEVARYVALDDAGVPRLVDARTHREVALTVAEGSALPSGVVVPLRDDLYLVAVERAHYLLDGTRARILRIDGQIHDAVRHGSELTAAVCKDDVLTVQRYGNGGTPRRVGTLGGCTRMRRVAIRSDGGAIAAAVADAAVVLLLDTNQPPMLVRTQVDRDGAERPVVWSLAGPFDADDSVIESFRYRRAGPMANAPLDPARDHAMRQRGVQAGFLAAPGAPRRGGR